MPLNSRHVIWCCFSGFSLI